MDHCQHSMVHLFQVVLVMFGLSNNSQESSVPFGCCNLPPPQLRRFQTNCIHWEGSKVIVQSEVIWMMILSEYYNIWISERLSIDVEEQLILICVHGYSWSNSTSYYACFCLTNNITYLSYLIVILFFVILNWYITRTLLLGKDIYNVNYISFPYWFLIYIVKYQILSTKLLDL